MLDRELFAQHITGLCEIYNKQPTKSLLELYYFVLQDMENVDFTNSIKNILQNRKYATLPKPAEILEYTRPNTQQLAIIAIDDIERAIRRGGAYSSITFEDKVINSIIDHLGGWIKVCQMSENEWKWAKKEIPLMYETYAKRAHHPAHLIGISEKDNGFTKEVSLVKAGYEVPKREIAIALNPSQKVTGKITNLVQRVKIA